MSDVIDVAQLFNKCADVFHVTNPVYVEVQDSIYYVTGVRNEQGMFILETATTMNGVVPRERS